jgi:hypothetical protein
MIDLPTLIFLISSHVYLLDSTSSPEVGSSRMITFGLVTIAMARDSFLFIPPESSITYRSTNSVSITTYKVSFMRDYVFSVFFKSHTN